MKYRISIVCKLDASLHNADLQKAFSLLLCKKRRSNLGDYTLNTSLTSRLLRGIVLVTIDIKKIPLHKYRFLFWMIVVLHDR